MEDNKDEKPEFREFTLDGEVYKTILTKKWLTRKPYLVKDPNKILSFIPGTINKVFVKEGQKVKNGESLLILEAMKMNNLILAPMHGIITKIHISQGEKVANNQLLLEIAEEKIKEKLKIKKKKKK